MARVIVVGAGLGGLPAAYELRHHLPHNCEVMLVSKESEFTFIPGLIGVALNLKPLSHMQLSLSDLAQRHHLNLLLGEVTQLDPHQRQLTVTEVSGLTRLLEYDYVMIAPGASLNFGAIPGLGPHGGFTQSVCTPDHAIAARTAWLQFLENPGPLVVGAAPGAGCFGPAYEFALMADYELRRLGLRDQVPITYVSPEPYVGHMGVSGVKNAERLTVELMERRGIEMIANMEITSVRQEAIALANGQLLPFKYAMILPSFQGVKFVRDVDGLADDRGFIPTLASQRHPHFPEIYAVGVSVKLTQPDLTEIPIGLPKSGQMTEAMATAAAHNIAVDLGAIRAPRHQPTLDALCFAEFGDTGIAYIAAPVVPDPATGKRRSSYAVRGPWIVWAKAAFEHYFMAKMRYGLGLPWFERLGLRTLFNVQLLKSLGNEHGEMLAQSLSEKELTAIAPSSQPPAPSR